MPRNVLIGSLALALLGLSVLWRGGPARAQGAATTDVSGIWVGSTQTGPSLELHLSEDSGQLSGYGLLQTPAPAEPVDFSFTGELTASGLGLLQTEGRSVTTGTPSATMVELAFAGEQAQARLVDGQAGTVTALTLNRQPSPSGGSTTPALRLWNNNLTPFQTYDPAEAYHFDYDITKNWTDTSSPVYHMHFNVRLAGSLISELAGSWTLEERDDSRGVRMALSDDLQFSSGRVAAWNYILSPNRSKLLVKTPDTLSVLSKISFNRLSSGTPGASDSVGVFSKWEGADVIVYIPKEGTWVVPFRDSYRDTGAVGYTVTLVSP